MSVPEEGSTTTRGELELAVDALLTEDVVENELVVFELVLVGTAAGATTGGVVVTLPIVVVLALKVIKLYSTLRSKASGQTLSKNGDKPISIFYYIDSL